MARFTPGQNRFAIKAEFGGRGKQFVTGYHKRLVLVYRRIESKRICPNIIRGNPLPRSRFIQRQGLKRLGRVMAHQMKITMSRPGFTRRFLDVYKPDSPITTTKIVTGLAAEPLKAGEAVMVNHDGTFSPFPRRERINENTTLITDCYQEVIPAEPKRKRVTVGQLRNLRPMYTVEGEVIPAEPESGRGWKLVEYITLMIPPGPKPIVEGEVEVKTSETVNAEQQIEHKE